VADFVSKEGLTQEALFKSCQRVQQMDSQSLMCLDWILASTEYIEFVNMMLEFKVSLVPNDICSTRRTGWMTTVNKKRRQPGRRSSYDM